MGLVTHKFRNRNVVLDKNFSETRLRSLQTWVSQFLPPFPHSTRKPLHWKGGCRIIHFQMCVWWGRHGTPIRVKISLPNFFDKIFRSLLPAMRKN